MIIELWQHKRTFANNAEVCNTSKQLLQFRYNFGIFTFRAVLYALQVIVFWNGDGAISYVEHIHALALFKDSKMSVFSCSSNSKESVYRQNGPKRWRESKKGRKRETQRIKQKKKNGWAKNEMQISHHVNASQRSCLLHVGTFFECINCCSNRFHNRQVFWLFATELGKTQEIILIWEKSLLTHKKLGKHENRINSKSFSAYKMSTKPNIWPHEVCSEFRFLLIFSCSSSFDSWHLFRTEI